QFLLRRLSHAGARPRDLQHHCEMRLRDFRQSRDQCLGPGRQMPRADDRLPLRHGARARDARAQGNGKGLSAPHRPRKHRAAEILRGDDRRRKPQIARRGGRGAQEGACGATRVSERLLFLTGRLAYPRLERMVRSFGDAAKDWRVHDIGVKVAALMTQEIVLRRLPRPVEADRVILPGRCRADLSLLSRELGVAVERGPEEIADLPAYLGRSGAAPDLSRHDMRLFAEIVDASTMSVPAIVERAARLAQAGADVIDLGCLPDTPFAHMEE